MSLPFPSCADCQHRLSPKCTPELYILESFPLSLRIFLQPAQLLHALPSRFSTMHYSNHKSHPSSTSSLSRTANTSVAIRRAKLEISDPIPISQEHLDELDSQVEDGRQGSHSSTSVMKPDTWPRRSTLPALRGLSPRDGPDDPLSHASNSYNNTDRKSAALTSIHQSMSSLPSGSSMRKSGGGIRATFRKIFGSKHRRDSISTGVTDLRSVSGTDLHSRITSLPFEIRATLISRRTAALF